jgi:hypothetical protein
MGAGPVLMWHLAFYFGWRIFGTARRGAAPARLAGAALAGWLAISLAQLFSAIFSSASAGCFQLFSAILFYQGIGH